MNQGCGVWREVEGSDDEVDVVQVLWMARRII